MSELKQLTQAVFELPECPEWAKSAAVDSEGDLWVCSGDKSTFTYIPLAYEDTWCIDGTNGDYVKKLDTGYDTTDWQNSPINRGENE